MSTRLSILDQSPIRADSTPAIALAESVQLAQRADALGFHRYWLAEHHGSQAFADGAFHHARLRATATQLRTACGNIRAAKCVHLTR